MKSILMAAAVLAGLATFPNLLRAQASAGEPSMADRHRMLGFLPAAEQDRVINAYDKAIANDPSLTADREDLKKGMEGMQDASDADRAAFRDKVKSYQDKLRAAMIKEDSSLGPVLDKVEKHRAEMAQQSSGPSSQ